MGKKNTPSEAMGALPKVKNAPAKPWERSQSPKMRQRSRGNAPEVQKRASEAAGMLPKPENAPARPWERSQSPKTRQRSRGSAPEAQKRASEAMGMLPKPENAPMMDTQQAFRSRTFCPCSDFACSRLHVRLACCTVLYLASQTMSPPVQRMLIMNPWSVSTAENNMCRP